MINIFKDINGNIVKRTPFTNPYTYDAYVICRYGENKEATYGDYSDRLSQWNSSKYEKSWGYGHDWDNGHLVETFLQNYYDNKLIRVVYITKEANKATGYPLYYVAWKIAEEINPSPTDKNTPK